MVNSIVTQVTKFWKCRTLEVNKPKALDGTSDDSIWLCPTCQDYNVGPICAYCLQGKNEQGKNEQVPEYLEHYQDHGGQG